jgi:uncharacterized protein with FMN-binding domain
MPKRGLIGVALTAGALVLLLSFKTPNFSALAGPGQVVVGQPNAGSSGAPNGGGGAQSSGSAGFSGSVTGPTVNIPFGNVQVKVTLKNGLITDVKTVQMPNSDPHSRQVSSYAAPRLRSEVLSAQSAQVNTISGATWTSDAYLQSLQAALDQAK